MKVNFLNDESDKLVQPSLDEMEPETDQYFGEKTEFEDNFDDVSLSDDLFNTDTEPSLSDDLLMDEDALSDDLFSEDDSDDLFSENILDDEPEVATEQEEAPAEAKQKKSSLDINKLRLIAASVIVLFGAFYLFSDVIMGLFESTDIEQPMYEENITGDPVQVKETDEDRGDVPKPDVIDPNATTTAKTEVVTPPPTKAEEKAVETTPPPASNKTSSETKPVQQFAKVSALFEVKPDKVKLQQVYLSENDLYFEVLGRDRTDIANYQRDYKNKVSDRSLSLVRTRETNKLISSLYRTTLDGNGDSTSSADDVEPIKTQIQSEIQSSGLRLVEMTTERPVNGKTPLYVRVRGSQSQVKSFLANAKTSKINITKFSLSAMEQGRVEGSNYLLTMRITN